MPLIRVPVMQYEDINGRPLAFAQAYFYQTGTTTPVDVYQDSAYVNPHTFPVVANALGQFPPIFANPALGLIRLKMIAAGGTLVTPLIDADPVNEVIPNGLGLASLTFVAQSADPLLPGILGDIEVPFACSIQRVTLLADVVGSIVVDIWKSTYAGYPPTNAGAITSVTPPTIAAALKSQQTVFAGWQTDIAAGSILRFNVNSCANIKRCTIAVAVLRTP